MIEASKLGRHWSEFPGFGHRSAPRQRRYHQRRFVYQSPQRSGFYALAYDWNGEKIVSYRGTDGLNDVTKGWTIGAGWTDQAQADLAVEFYKAATGLDAFSSADHMH